MAQEPLNTEVVMMEAFGNKKIGNLVLNDAKFWGRPNFSGEEDRFRDSRRKFTVLIPNDVADTLRSLGWNVKTKTTDAEGNPLEEPISSMKVMMNFKMDPDHPNDINYEKGPSVWAIMGENREKLNSRTVGILDRSRVMNMGMEIRGWEYDPEEEPGKFSARLVEFVAEIQPSLLEQKFGPLR